MVQRLAVQARDIVFRVVPAILMATITLVLVADVAGRYIFNSPIMWAPELAVFAFVWLVYLGAVDVSLCRSHIAVDALTDLLPGRVQAAITAVVQLLTVALLTYLAWYGLQYFLNGNFTSLPTLGISQRYTELAIPVGATGMALVALVDLWAAIRGLVTGNYGEGDDPDVTPDDVSGRAFEIEVKKVMDQA